jgi:profilin
MSWAGPCDATAFAIAPDRHLGTDYVSNLTATGFISQAAICGQAGGGSVWAKSDDFEVTDAEVQTLVAAALGDPSTLFGTGIHLAGTKYLTIRASEDEIAGKKGVSRAHPKLAACRAHWEQGAGVAIFKTTQALLIGVYADGTLPGSANKASGSAAATTTD